MARTIFSPRARVPLIIGILLAFLLLAALVWTVVGHHPAPLVRADAVRLVPAL